MLKDEILQEIKYNEQGLVCVIVQDYHSKHIRMQAYMNEEALIKTLETKIVHFYSRSRRKLWMKGETSGNIQYLKGLSIDCDGDALLLQVEQKNNITCHTGNVTCFYRDLTDQNLMEIHEKNDIKAQSQQDALSKLYEIVNHRKNHKKEGSYTNYLLDKGLDKILKKVGEETTEVVIAAKNNLTLETTYEIADLMYHLTVMMVEMGITWDDVKEELDKR